MKIRELFVNVEYKLIKGNMEDSVASVFYDSRKVESDSMFVALKGYQTDGHKYIESAVANGASALVVEEEHVDEVKLVAKNAAIISVKDSRVALAGIAKNYFGNAADNMKIIGITGTKGKTTTSFMTRAILEKAGIKTGLIGSMGAYYDNEYEELENTTPESYEIHRLLHNMKEVGCRYVVMEISSQGLKMNRVHGLNFEYGIFLNIGQDHISETEHGSYEEYFNCKKKLKNQSKKFILNIANEELKTYAEELKNAGEDIITIASDAESDFSGINIKNFLDKKTLRCEYTLQHEGERPGIINLNFIGDFNVVDSLAAVAATYNEGIHLETIKAALSGVKVRGRSELVNAVIREEKGDELARRIEPIIISDYAHNELSADFLLKAIKPFVKNRLICMFGCGGNKPKARRVGMGRAASKYADLTVLTSDNPSTEKLSKIFREIREGLAENRCESMVIEDREDALRYLLNNTEDDDIVVIMGKGHELYQIIGNKKIPYNEKETIVELLNK